ncbi:MAG: hypothetical protein INH41_27795 [Myxococcaceae bacterium]|nr:hypothetical protein [Myxococcaceae bacterium]MCA3016205.1 hypothetical protein [Myxococcaceae bacterium]
MTHRLSQRPVVRVVGALALLGVQALLAVHFALEAHTVSADGVLIDLREGEAAHAHLERSLCDGAEFDAARVDAGPCEAQGDPWADEAPALMAVPVAAAMTGPARRALRGAARTAVWRVAPKGSPPGV